MLKLFTFVVAVTLLEICIEMIFMLGLWKT